MAAGVWAMALPAQTLPQQFPGMPQFTQTPKPRAVRPETARFPRQTLQLHVVEEPAVCSIALLEAPVTKNLEQMPVLRPRADNIDNMPLAKMPAPPCEEENR
jgi:hypothetical protein